MSTTQATSQATRTVLRIDSSARTQGSISRAVLDHLVAELAAQPGHASLITRDIAKGLPMVDGAWIEAAYTDPSARTPAQRDKLALSDSLVAELEAADTILIGAPMYNFSVPAALKAWIDQICRVRVTFRYSEQGIEGLLKGKRAIVVITSGGVPLGAPVDFVTPYIRHVLGFVGITDVTVIDAGRLNFEGAAKIDAAKAAASAAVQRLPLAA